MPVTASATHAVTTSVAAAAASSGAAVHQGSAPGVAIPQDRTFTAPVAQAPSPAAAAAAAGAAVQSTRIAAAAATTAASLALAPTAHASATATAAAAATAAASVPYGNGAFQAGGPVHALAGEEGDIDVMAQPRRKRVRFDDGKRVLEDVVTMEVRVEGRGEFGIRDEDEADGRRVLAACVEAREWQGERGEERGGSKLTVLEARPVPSRSTSAGG